MDFTVIIPSRNRPALLRKAIDSVLMQTHLSVEVLVVNDGSDGENERAYSDLAIELKERVRFLNLEHAKNGHGQSGAINRGADVATGKYLCFLDDDDYWTDPDHLKRAANCLHAHADSVNVYFANQNAVLNGVHVPGPIWLESLTEKISTDTSPDESGAYPVTLTQLMSCPGFGHLNTTIVSRALYLQICGMDENIRYECDLDFYLRILDASSGIYYYPGIVSLHNAPDPSKALNMSTVVSFVQKMLFRAYVWDKALLFSKSREIRAQALKSKSYTLKKIAQSLAQDQHFVPAHYYARLGFVGGFNLKWFAYCQYLRMRSWFGD